MAERDNPELEDLFDSIVAQQEAAVAKPTVRPSTVAPAASAAGDSPDLEALFDSIVAQQQGGAESGSMVGESSVASGGQWEGQQEKTFNKIGQMARTLHDALLGLGYDKLLEKTVNALPDAQDRLAYVANLTEQAACKVLNATDIAMPVQEQLGQSGEALSARWEKMYANELSVEEFKALAADTRVFFSKQLPDAVSLTNAQLMEIMMAQDFQDLTGQVIKKIVVLAKEMESSIMSVLIEIIPEVKKTEAVNSLLNGPVINADGRADVVVGQTQVDDLLESLGF